MKRFDKIYYEPDESTTDIGEYIIAQEPDKPEPYKSFVENNIGKIISKTVKNKYFPSTNIVQYENVPNELKTVNLGTGFFDGGKWTVKNKNILKHSKNREDLEIYIDQKKYNI